MKFLVTRTSRDDSIKPLDDERLVFGTYDKFDRRTCTEEEFNKNHLEKSFWRDRGTDHTTWNNHMWIERRFPDACSGWFIELNTLEELIDLIKKDENEVIINVHTLEEYDFAIIEFYDSYRE